MENGSNITTLVWCQTSPDWNTLIYRVQLVAYGILAIIYFVFGLFGRIISLLSIYKHTKADGAYLYQIMLLINEILEILIYGLYAFMSYWVDAYGETTPVWFRRSYVCMWMAANLALYPPEALTACSLCLTLAMSVDRIFSLAKPFVYRQLPHKKIQWTVWIVCIFLALFTNLHLSMLLEIGYATDRDGANMYEFRRRNNPTVQAVWSSIYAVFRFSMTSILFLSNFVLYAVHRRRMLDKSQNGGANGTKSTKAIESSKTLFKMTLCQSILITIGQVALITCQIGRITVENYETCYLPIWAGIADSIASMADTIKFYCLLIISKSFRDMAIKALKTLNPFNVMTNKVQTITVTHNHRTVATGGD